VGYATPIRVLEQVDYRLALNCGCDRTQDAQVEYRLAGTSELRWVGSGLPELDLVAGEAVDPDIARALMDGRDWRSGKQLVNRKRVLDPRGKVVARVVVDAIAEAAAEEGVTVAEYLGAPGLAARLARAERGILRDGEAHLIPVDVAERLAAAAGLSITALYGEDVVDEARRWRGHHVDVGLRGVDVTLDLPKSLSVAVALSSPERAAALEEEWIASVQEGVAALERWAGYGMAGHHGDGERAERVESSGLLGWITLHRSARPVDNAPGDPHLHVHVNLAHMVKCADGKWRAPGAGGEDFHRYARVINEIAEGRFRARLIEKYGARFERSETTGAWELAGVDEELRTAFSRRHQQVLDLVGKDATREQQKAAARITAEAKEDTENTPREDWRTRAIAVLGSEAALEEMVAAALPGPDGPAPAPSAGGRGPLLPSPEQIARQIWDPEHGLTAHQKVVQHTHVMAAVAGAMPSLESVEQLLTLTEEVLAVDGHAVRLADSGRQHHSHRQRYTHGTVVEAERIIIEAASAGLDAGLAQLTSQAAELAVATAETAQGFDFSTEQRAVVERLLTAGHAADGVIGVAGSGKTTLMTAARTGWEAAGLRVAGASTAAVAAANLTAEAGIDSRTIAAWTREITGGRGLQGVDVLVVDEAAMVDDRALAALLQHAAGTGTKVVGIGDPLQLRAIGVGGGFARIHRIVDGLTLSENRRQVDVVERAALQTWRDGGRTTALSQLAGHGRIHAEETATDALTGMLAAWNGVRGRWEGDPHGQIAELLLLAARRDDVAVLNAGARAVRVAAGELGPGRTYAVAGGERLTVGAGDLVHIRRNDYRSRRDAGQPDVLNGFRGVAAAVDDHRGVLVEWQRPGRDGEVRVERAWMSPTDIAEGRLTLGYAMTIGSAQGLTAAVTIGYGLHADAHSLYPALSRARQESHLWLPLQELEDDVDRARLGEPRSEQEVLDRAVAAYGRQLERDAGDAMVVDELPAPRAVESPPVAQEPVSRPVEPEQAPLDPEAAEAARAGALGFPERPGAVREVPEVPTAQEDPSERSEEPSQAPHWRQRPHGSVPTPQLETQAEAHDSRARHAEHQADQAERRAAAIEEELAASPTPGQARADAAAAMLNAAAQHARTAAQEAAREQEARLDVQRAREALRAVERASTKSRIALRMVGTSRREQRDLSQRLHAQLDVSSQEAHRARRAGAEARGRAWETVINSPFAEALREHGAHRRPPADHRELQQRLEQMRGHLPALAERLDAHRRREAYLAHASARTSYREAVQHRESAAGLRAERQLREGQDPMQRIAETQQRIQALQQQRQLQEEHQRQMREQQLTRSYQPPAPGRDGPSLGM
jgi:conjugative relaxase-like TrwC/TraI family protein